MSPGLVSILMNRNSKNPRFVVSCFGTEQMWEADGGVGGWLWGAVSGVLSDQGSPLAAPGLEVPKMQGNLCNPAKPWSGHPGTLIVWISQYVQSSLSRNQLQKLFAPVIAMA